MRQAFPRIPSREGSVGSGLPAASPAAAHRRRGDASPAWREYSLNVLLRADPLSRVSKNSDGTELRWALEGNVTHVLPSARAKSDELEAAAKNEPPEREHELLLRDAAQNGVCGRMHEGIPVPFLGAAEPPTEGMQLRLVPCLSFPQGPSAVCVSSC